MPTAQLDLAVRAGDTSSEPPLPPEVHELTSMSPEDFAAQWRRWHRALKTRYELAEACEWSGEACQELEQHVSYLVSRSKAGEGREGQECQVASAGGTWGMYKCG